MYNAISWKMDMEKFAQQFYAFLSPVDRRASPQGRALDRSSDEWGLLMHRSQNGERVAYRELLEKIAGWLDTVGADERITAIVLVSVHEQRASFGRRSCFANWLSAVVIGRIKPTKNRQHFSLRHLWGRSTQRYGRNPSSARV